jgi:hypothetical protein
MKRIDERNKAALEKAIQEVKEERVNEWPSTFSVFAHGSKTGDIPAVNRTPGTCGTCCMNCKECYAKKGNFVRQNVIDANARRTALSIEKPETYWNMINAGVALQRYIRYFGSGDIGTKEYLAGMVKTAQNNPGTLFMAFTQYHDIVNAWIDENGELPENLIIIFSTLCRGGTINNPHNMPVSVVVDEEEIPAVLAEHPDWLMCGGSCEDCACRGLGCWRIRKGETIILKKH